jgi:hypothetical protein
MFEGLKHLSKAKAIHNWFIISELFTTKADFFTSTITDGLQARQSRNNKTRGGGQKEKRKSVAEKPPQNAVKDLPSSLLRNYTYACH